MPSPTRRIPILPALLALLVLGCAGPRGPGQQAGAPTLLLFHGESGVHPRPAPKGFEHVIAVTPGAQPIAIVEWSPAVQPYVYKIKIAAWPSANPPSSEQLMFGVSRMDDQGALADTDWVKFDSKTGDLEVEFHLAAAGKDPTTIKSTYRLPGGSMQTRPMPVRGAFVDDKQALPPPVLVHKTAKETQRLQLNAKGRELHFFLRSLP